MQGWYVLICTYRSLLVICIFKGGNKDLLSTYFLSDTILSFFHPSECSQKYCKQHPVDLLLPEITKTHFHFDLRKLEPITTFPLHFVFFLFLFCRAEVINSGYTLKLPEWLLQILPSGCHPKIFIITFGSFV